LGLDNRNDVLIEYIPEGMVADRKRGSESIRLAGSSGAMMARMSRKEMCMSELQQMSYVPERMHLKPERVQQLLRELPGWSLGAGGCAIERSREFESVAEAAEFVGRAGKLAMAQRQPVRIALAGRNVSLTLAGHPRKGCTGGLTNPVFRLAAKLG
jgi:pterin-4a-carbinolamine dehydratase